MSIDWFRSWHGAPTDPKWLLIAKLAMKRSVTQCNTITPGMVSAVVWALFDHASQHSERGCVDDFDVETYASWSGFEEADIAAIIAALNDKSVIESGVLSAWEKRQPKREDNSTERVRRHRDAVKRSETQGNDREDKEKRREEKKEREDADASAPAAAPPSAEVDYFRRAKEVVGVSKGGMIGKKLLTAKGGSIPSARAAVEQASMKENPEQYLWGVINNKGSPEEERLARRSF